MTEELRVIISASIEGLKQACGEAKTQVEGLEKTSSGAGSKIKSAFSTIGKGVAVAGAAVATTCVAAGKQIYNMAIEVSNAADTIDKASQRMGVDAEYYQELAYACEMNGVSMGAMEKAAKQLQASGSELNFEQAMQQILSLEDAEQRSAMAAQLFGEKVAYEMTPMINAGADGFNALIDEAHQYGAIMSNDAVSAGATFNDSLTRLQKTVEGVKTQFIGDLLPAITQITDGLAGLIAGVDGAEEQFAEGVQNIIQGIIDALPRFTDAVETIVAKILETIVDNLPQIVDAGVRLLTSLIQDLGRIINKIVPAIPTIVISLVNAIVNNIPVIVEAGVTLLIALVKNLPKIIIEVVKAIPKILEAIVKAIIGGVSQIADAGKQLVQGLFQGISNSLQWIKDKIRGWVGNVLSFIKNLFGIHSPSKVMAGYGDFLVMGLGEGITDNTKHATKAMAALAEEVEGAFNPELQVPTVEASNIDLNSVATIKQKMKVETSEDWVNTLVDRLTERNTEVNLVVNDKVLAQTTIESINALTRSTGKLGLSLG